VQLYPIFHPAAALYTPSMLETLRVDFLRIPGLLASGGTEDYAPIAPQLVAAHAGAQPEPEPAQLGLF
jgi:DNA polymerase